MNNSTLEGVSGEFQKHYGSLLMYPSRTDIWRNNAVPMQEYICTIVNILSQYEKVFLCCERKNIQKLRNQYGSNGNVIIIECEYDDIWARDISPTFIREQEQWKCLDWKFNSWGGKKEGAYYPWDSDDKFASVIAKYFDLICQRVDITLEGGAILSDGKGTLFTTRSVLLNRNRNPFVSKATIENLLIEKLHVRQVIWLKHGLKTDETNGHIDNIITFVDSENVCLAWTDDKTNENYDRVREAYQTISNVVSCSGKKYNIILVPLPREQVMTEEEEQGLNKNINSLERKAGDKLPASYINIYISNEVVLIPSFGCPEDKVAYEIYSRLFKNKRIEQIYSREALLGGGGLHCLIHEIPEL